MIARIYCLLERAVHYLNGKGYGTSKHVASEVRYVSRFCTGGVLFDVGANRGLYTRELLRRFGSKAQRIYCFEPSKELVANDLHFDDPRVVLVNAALGESDQMGVLYGTTSDSGLSSLRKRRLDHFGIEMAHEQDVHITTIDAFVEQHSIASLDLLKLDVEGNELDVLKGAKQCLAGRKIKCIQFEFGGCNIDSRTFFQDFWYLLVKQHGFRLFRITPLGLIYVSRYEECDETFLTTNYIAVL